MAIPVDVIKLLSDDPMALKILDYLRRQKSASIYQISEAVQAPPADCRHSLSKLEEYQVIEKSGASGTAQVALGASPYSLTGYGHEVAKVAKREL